ncbi:MAG: hypothetical protein FWG90_03810 [Oscillospiraceae bacterium]|nr:hypothetical protein [Oscillospiraceae bacterium]
MKKLISAVLALTCAVTAIGTATFANNEPLDGLIEGIEFKSVTELETYLAEVQKTGKTPGVSGEISKYLSSMDTLYYPKSLDASKDISTIFVASTEVFVSFKFGNQFSEFKHYIDDATAKNKIEEAKTMLTDKEFSATSKVQGEYTVYSYVLAGASNYIWVQDGKTFSLVLNGTTEYDKHYDLCYAASKQLNKGDNTAVKKEEAKTGRTGWVRNSSTGQRRYYKNGEYLVGSHIFPDGKEYVFDKNGIYLGRRTPKAG